MSFLDSRKSVIFLSLGIAAAVIVGAYLASGHGLGNPGVASAESTNDILKAYAAKDTDNDGLPDWEEALYGTDPNNAHSVRADITDGQAVAQGIATPRYSGQPAAATSTEDLAAEVPGNAPAAGSLTQQFAILFYNNYITTRGDAPPSPAAMQSFVQSAVDELVKTQVRPDAFTQSDLKVSGTGASALQSYAASAEAALAANAVHTDYGEMTYFEDAVQKNDANAIKNIGLISKEYEDTAVALTKIPVPQEAASAHLSLVNAMARVGATIGDLSTVGEDPIRAMVALGAYPDDAQALADSFAGMNAVFVSNKVSIPGGTPGASFYHVTAVAAEGVAAGKKQ